MTICMHLHVVMLFKYDKCEQETKIFHTMYTYIKFLFFFFCSYAFLMLLKFFDKIEGWNGEFSTGEFKNQ